MRNVVVSAKRKDYNAWRDKIRFKKFLKKYLTIKKRFGKINLAAEKAALILEN